MKKLKTYVLIFINFVLTFIISSTSLSAQRDTTGTSAKTDSIIQYLTPLEYAFMMHEETRFMLRMPAIGVGAELEILPYITLMGQAELLYYTGYYDYNTGLTGEARMYYGSKKKGVRNMSGNYFALGYQHQTDFHSMLDHSYVNRYYARWGMQRRFLGSGLIDLGVNAGYEKYGRDWVDGISYTDERFFLQTTGIIGLGLVFNNEKALDKDRLCPALKCYERETFLLKINTLDLLTLKYSDRQKQSLIRFNPQIGVEQKLFNSPFSIDANLKANFNWVHNSSDNSYNSTYLDLFGRVQARYYYNLKNRILKGKSGNGFAANYISGGVYQRYNTGSSDHFKQNEYGLTLTTGIQRTFSKRLYFDVELGGAYDLRNDRGFFLYGDVQVGIKF